MESFFYTLVMFNTISFQPGFLCAQKTCNLFTFAVWKTNLRSRMPLQ